MFKVIRTRLRQGCKTAAYPEKPMPLPDRFLGRPHIDPLCPPAIVATCVAGCPQQAIEAATSRIDLGRCIFCGVCEQLSLGRFARFSTEHRLAASHRADLVTNGELPRLAGEKLEHVRRVFGRSLALRQVSAGGCNACEAETNVLNTPVYDLARFGIQFVASPRHADGLHVTGPVTRNMRAALLATYDAVPSPKVVIAAGTCAISGGVFHGSEAIVPLDSLLPVDLFIPGCPPHPLTTLAALLEFFKGKRLRS